MTLALISIENMARWCTYGFARAFQFLLKIYNPFGMLSGRERKQRRAKTDF